MRLINVQTLALEDFTAAGAIPPYAILSHTWGPTASEVTYHDLQDLDSASRKAGFAKIRHTTEQAIRDGLGYAWVDTCCIDKSSSTELSEAINSMYRWYTNAAVCYCYLVDVPGNSPPLNDGFLHPASIRFVEAFEESRYFTRGWTLQELIAPRIVHFFGESFNHIGTLSQLIGRVSQITGIQQDVLDRSTPLYDLSIARRLSWAARRETTRIEDQAYSLFGILDVNMPLLYGEGAKAFQRLQEHIIAQSTDQSILAWDSPAGPINSRELLLAPSPKCFANGSKIRRRRGAGSESAFRMGNNGLEISLPILRRRLSDTTQTVLGILDCRYEDSPDVLALVMSQHPFISGSAASSLELYVSGYERRRGDVRQYARLLLVPQHELHDVISKQLTITKDLRSRTYMQDFSFNDTSWFPIRLTGDELSSLLSLHHVYPDQCWSEPSRTLRLRPPQYQYGGIIVGTGASGHVLVVFGVRFTPRGVPLREIYSIVPIHPKCPIKPHLRYILRQLDPVGAEVKRFLLPGRQRLVAQVYLGAALTISVESVDDYTSPTMTPTSPTLSRASTSSSRRHDSFHDDSRRPSSSSSSGPSKNVTDGPAVQWIPECRNCQDVRERERRRLANEAAQRRKEEKEQTRDHRMKRAKQVASGLSIGSLLADMAEIDIF